MASVDYTIFAPTSAGDQTTVDAYADVFVAGSKTPKSDALKTQGAIWDVRRFLRWTIAVKNTGGANGLTYQVLGSVEDKDPVNFDSVLGTGNVAFGATTILKGQDYYTFIKVQIKAQVGGSQTTCAVRAASVSG